MANRLTIDIVTVDSSTDEWVLYLVENGPWHAEQLAERLRELQSRVYSALDALIDGQFGDQFPDSVGRTARIQVDFHGEVPPIARDLVQRLAVHITDDEDYQRDLALSRFVESVRIVTDEDIGRTE